MGAFLVTGNPGSGKTSLALELSRRGSVAVDADQFARWHATDGTEVEEPADADDDWRLSHKWMWRRALLEDFIAGQPAGRDVLVCGIAMNQRDVRHLFDSVFLLSLDYATQVQRLDTADNAGRSAALRAQIIEGRAVFEGETVAAGALVLDGREPTATLADTVLALVAQHRHTSHPSHPSHPSRHA